MQNLNESLNEVRKAYRLLFDFQSRILNLINFIGGRFDFDYSGGFPKFGAQSPRNGSGHLKLWAWDWLNFYFYEFHFQSKVVNNDSLRFSIFIVCDSGYFDAKKSNTVSKTDTSSFLDTDHSLSKLIFVAAKNTWGLFGEENWNNVAFTTEEYGYKTDENGTMIFKSYNLEEFENEIRANNSLLDFQNFCLKNDIMITIKERKFV